MKIAVLGAGVVGVTSAWYLARAGHEVTVVDRQDAAAMETSFANGGQISTSHAEPWANPATPKQVLKWLGREDSPMLFRLRADPYQWTWGLAFLRECLPARTRANAAQIAAINRYSKAQLQALRADTGIEYDERSRGTIQLFRTQRQLDGIGKDVEILKDFGVPFEVLDRDGCCRYEPALARVKEKFVGALRLPGDETGDCYKFTQRLAAMAEALGVEFKYGTAIEALIHAGGRVSGARTGTGTLTADRTLVALGSYSTLMLKPLGIDLPVYPVKGYSITVPITDPDGAPASTLIDETHKVAITRLGERIRVGGTAELAGNDLGLPKSRLAALKHVATDLFPQGGDVAQAEFWCGLRPMTPDSTPIIGGTGIANLFLATGHGTLGWTMAAGTGRVMADLIAGKSPEIDTAGLTLTRYRSS